jgi:transketolase
MTQSQRESLLDLLILSIFIDSHVSLKEDHELQASFEAVGWEAEKPRDIFICTSMNRARKASDTDADTAAYIISRTAVFTDAESQATALDLLQRVLAGDGVSPAEAEFLARVKSAFP